MYQFTLSLLIMVAVVFGLWGFDSITVATLGVGRIGIACVIGILARLLQAEYHHRQLLDAREE